jgi:hypothetical protein
MDRVVPYCPLFSVQLPCRISVKPNLQEQGNCVVTSAVIIPRVAFPPTTPSTDQLAAELSALYCSSGTTMGLGTDACPVMLTAAAPSGGLIVNLSSSSSAVDGTEHGDSTGRCDQRGDSRLRHPRWRPLRR